MSKLVMQVVKGGITGRCASFVPLNCAVVRMMNKAAEVSKLSLVLLFNTQLLFLFVIVLVSQSCCQWVHPVFFCYGGISKRKKPAHEEKTSTKVNK